MTDKLNMGKPVNNEKPQIINAFSQLDFGFSIVALFSTAIATLNFFFFGLNIYLPFFLQLFTGLAFFGVPLATIALLIAIPLKWRRSSNAENFTRLGLLSTMLLIVASLVIFHLPNFLTNYGMRLLVEHHGGINNLVQWSDSIMEKPLEQVVTNPDRTEFANVRQELFSEQVNKIARAWVFLVTKEQGKCVLIEIGGGGHFTFAWGVVITSREMKINKNVQKANLYKWQDRVYGFSGYNWKTLFESNEKKQ